MQQFCLNILRGNFKNLFLALGLMIFLINANAAPVKLGVDYVVAKNAPSQKINKGKINIKEFFSFTCIHCKDVEPLIEANIASNKKVDLERIQVTWDAKTTTLAKLNATYVMLNLNNLYTPTFNAIFNGQDLTENKTLVAFLQQNKVDINKFMATYNSFDVSIIPGKYKALMSQYNVEGTPTFVVADKYILKPATPERIIEVLQYLIKQQGK